MKAYDKMIQQCDADIRAGRLQEVSKNLNGLNTARVPREWRLPLARICRRAGLYTLGMTLLNKLVQPTARRAEILAAPSELAEYAALLMRFGAVNESLQRLDNIDGAAVPEAHLFRAFAQFYRWEFNDAIVELEAYIRAPLTDYARLVGRVNLAHAYVESGQDQAAFKLLSEIMAANETGGNTNLQSHCHAFLAQVFMRAGDFTQAKFHLQLAEKITGSNFGLVSKWRNIVEAMETKSLMPLDRLRIESRQQQDWEALREADLFALKVEFDNVRFLHLLFGTPIHGYRQRIFAELGRTTDRTMYVLGEKTAPRLDMQTGSIDGHPILAAGRKCHQLLEILLRDFYRPQRIGSLFFDLFPGEYFNISSSPDRIHQIIWRTRRWLEDEQLPVQIHEANGFFQLQIIGPFSVRIPLKREAVDLMSLQLKDLRHAFPAAGQVFTLRQACEQMRLSKATVWRLLKWAMNKGNVEKLGADSTTTYRLTGVEMAPVAGLRLIAPAA